MTEKINDSVMHQKHQQEIFPVRKKAIPGASWNGSHFLSRSSTTICCELFTYNLTPVLKTEASIRFENIFHLGIGIVLRLRIKQVEQKINKNYLATPLMLTGFMKNA